MATAGRLDAPARPVSSEGRVQQPKPQVLPSRTGGSSILVSSRQKGNPILNYVRSVPWEYADTPADYVLGLTTCALFLSLKYHRLHPEYIYSRIRGISGMFNLRILLAMVDIDNHDEALKELSKTSLINNVTLVLCWSSQEAGRYLELFKSYEGASAASIRGHQSTSYSDRLNEFVTVPRGINKTDAVGLVSSFGSVRTAVNANPEEVAQIAGWGEKKVKRWCDTVRENFRAKKAAKRALPDEGSRSDAVGDVSRRSSSQERSTTRQVRQHARSDRSRSPSHLRAVTSIDADEEEQSVDSRIQLPDADEESAMLEASLQDPLPGPKRKVEHLPSANDGLDEGISAALKRLRRED